MRGETDEMMTEAASEIGAAVTEMTGGPVEDGKTTEKGEEGEGFVMTIGRAGGSRGGVETPRRGVTGTQQTGRGRGERRSTPDCRAWLA